MMINSLSLFIQGRSQVPSINIFDGLFITISGVDYYLTTDISNINYYIQLTI